MLTALAHFFLEKYSLLINFHAGILGTIISKNTVNTKTLIHNIAKALHLVEDITLGFAVTSAATAHIIWAS